MEFQFRRDYSGKPEAVFSMGHEAMGQWLVTELGTNQKRLTDLLVIIDDLLANNKWEYQLQGGEYNLSLSRDSAEVRSDLLDSEMMTDENEDLDYYDSESSSQCGLNDFKMMLESWQDYIAKK